MLIKPVLESLSIFKSESDLRERIKDVLEQLVSYGDLLELKDVTDESRASKLLYAAPLSFVQRDDGSILLLGIAKDEWLPLPGEMVEKIIYIGHTRQVVGGQSDWSKLLSDLGLIQISIEAWTKGPADEAPGDHIKRFDRILNERSMSGSIPELEILNPRSPVRYYKKRWQRLTDESGRYIARRPQAYGANLWCYCEVQNGEVIKFVDLPLRDDQARGCDDAWRLQSAIDLENDLPQIYEVQEESPEKSVIRYFSPIPRWAERRLETFGVRRSAFSFVFENIRITEETKFLEDRCWLRDVKFST
jgi:hypothetical protein|tara:strand:+ start:40 stop:951 length:912 start_codon:yes stop_codon:yes gene_type:complete